MPALTDLTRKNKLIAVGSNQSELLPLSLGRRLITNTNVLTAEGSSLVLAAAPIESVDLSASGAQFMIRRQATSLLILAFSMGDAADPNNLTAGVIVRAWRPRVWGGQVQWRGRYLCGFALTCGNQVDTNSLLLPAVVPAAATSFKHVDTIAALGSGDKSISSSVKYISSVTDGIAEVGLDTGGAPVITIEGSLNGSTADCLSGEYCEI